jgi:Ca2+-binding EF-hand superfamily protein
MEGDIGKLITQKGLKKIFDSYDHRKQGFIDEKDISKIAKDLGEGMDTE